MMHACTFPPHSVLTIPQNETINPSTYKTLDKPGYWGVHAIGEVWAEMLWVVAQRLIAKHGFTESLFPPLPLEDGTIPIGDFYRAPDSTPTGASKTLVPKHGNSLMMQLVLNAMKMQQCRPGFFEARDAIIQADQVLTGGENFCDLWLGFAEKGLGLDATVQGRTPWGGGIRTSVSAPYHMAPTLAVVNVFCRVSMCRPYASPRRLPSLNPLQVSLARMTRRMTGLGHRNDLSSHISILS
jgi:Fungalysin metallopeptidase (M36)